MKSDASPASIPSGWFQRARAGIAVLLSFAVVGLPARACCDDFLSCAAAVATAGLSCAAEAALKTITDAIDALQQHRNAAVTQVNLTLDSQTKADESQLAQINAQVNQLLARIAQAGTDGGVMSTGDSKTNRPSSAQIAGESVGAAANAPAAKLTKLKQGTVAGAELHLAEEYPDESPSLAGLRTELAALVAKKQELIKELGNEKAETVAQEEAAAARGKNAFFEAFLDPVDRALKSLDDLRDHPLDVGDDVKVALELLEAAEGGFLDVVVPALNQAVSDIQGAVQLPVSFLLALENEARRADELAAAIQRMTTAHSEEERATIVLKMDGTPTKPSTVKLATAYGLSDKTLVAMKSKVAKQSASAKAAVERIAVPHARMDTVAYRVKLAGDLDTYFKGVPVAAARRKRDELIGEAKVRYAKDPTTLKALEKYLRDEARARGVD